jgi:Family of unknown function (DUF5678)
MAGVPSLEGLRERFDEADRELQWWAEHQAEFVKLYPDQFVAVHNGEVVAVANSIGGLKKKLAAKSLGFDDVKSSFITADPSKLIL